MSEFDTTDDGAVERLVLAATDLADVFSTWDTRDDLAARMTLEEAEAISNLLAALDRIDDASGMMLAWARADDEMARENADMLRDVWGIVPSETGWAVER